MTHYDTWKIDFDDTPDELEIAEHLVPRHRGIFAWQDFCNLEPQGTVEDWAWEACKNGPFTSLLDWLSYWRFLVFARLKGSSDLAKIAGLRACNPDYLEAANEVESTWSFQFANHKLVAIEEEDGSINIYRTKDS